MKARLRKWQTDVEAKQKLAGGESGFTLVMLNYVIFLRLSPLIPNWFVTIASPILGIRMYVGYFFFIFMCSMRGFQ